ncbi:MAG TPA: hypothetical protein VGQ12_08385 [Candidatus Angelobacter sp.]|jgi:hypothetical protein|nr:hypothetical protein [Candidatus Angelobacter sp.]
MRIEFDSLMLPDGAAIPIRAAATDLEMRLLKGKVEVKNTGKNVLVRSLSGIGQTWTERLHFWRPGALIAVPRAEGQERTFLSRISTSPAHIEQVKMAAGRQAATVGCVVVLNAPYSQPNPVSFCASIKASAFLYPDFQLSPLLLNQFAIIIYVCASKNQNSVCNWHASKKAPWIALLACMEARAISAPVGLGRYDYRNTELADDC